MVNGPPRALTSALQLEFIARSKVIDLPCSMSVCKACSFCNFLAPSLTLWLSHVRTVHGSDPAFEIECCSVKYSKCSSFVSHMYRKHRNELSVASMSDPKELPTVIDFHTDETASFSNKSCDVGDHAVQHAVHQLL